MRKTASVFHLLTAGVLMAALCFFLPGLLSGAEKDRVYKSILNGAAGYTVYDAFCADIYYTAQDREYADTIAHCLDFFAPLLYRDFGVGEAPPVSVVIYENAKTMADALGVDESAAPMGLYYNGVINVLSPTAWIKAGTESHIKERFVKEGPLIHELAHLLTDIKTGGHYPIWLTEGVALYYENKYAAFEWREDLKEESAALSLADLEADFRRLDEAKAYRRSFDLVNDFAAQNGEEALQAMLAGLK